MRIEKYKVYITYYHQNKSIKEFEENGKKVNF